MTPEQKQAADEAARKSRAESKTTESSGGSSSSSSAPPNQGFARKAKPVAKRSLPTFRPSFQAPSSPLSPSSQGESDLSVSLDLDDYA